MFDLGAEQPRDAFAIAWLIIVANVRSRRVRLSPGQKTVVKRQSKPVAYDTQSSESRSCRPTKSTTTSSFLL